MANTKWTCKSRLAYTAVLYPPTCDSNYDTLSFQNLSALHNEHSEAVWSTYTSTLQNVLGKYASTPVVYHGIPLIAAWQPSVSPSPERHLKFESFKELQILQHNLSVSPLAELGQSQCRRRPCLAWHSRLGVLENINVIVIVYTFNRKQKKTLLEARHH